MAPECGDKILFSLAWFPARGALCSAALALAGLSAAAQLPSRTDNALIAAAAESQVGVTRRYDPSYVRLRYPGGDVPLDRGVCSDVVVRAMRRVGIDLQVAVHEDMKRNFAEYPQLWGLRGPDPNIDHRRVPNLMRFFQRKGKHLKRGAAWRPGDIVAWKLPDGLYHIGVISRKRVPGTDRYFAVHNIGAGTQIEDVLFTFEILGHYRW